MKTLLQNTISITNVKGKVIIFSISYLIWFEWLRSHRILILFMMYVELLLLLKLQYPTDFRKYKNNK